MRDFQQPTPNRVRLAMQQSRTLAQPVSVVFSGQFGNDVPQLGLADLIGFVHGGIVWRN